MADIIPDTNEWFVTAKQQTEELKPNPAQVAFYFGMQLEELAEKLELVSPNDAKWLHGLAKGYKAGMADGMIATALTNPAVAKAFLDADVDSVWVTIGSARAQGADLAGAYDAVRTANWNKRWPDGEFHLDPKTRKVMKPEGWSAADLTRFVHPTLR